MNKIICFKLRVEIELSLIDTKTYHKIIKTIVTIVNYTNKLIIISNINLWMKLKYKIPTKTTINNVEYH